MGKVFLITLIQMSFSTTTKLDVFIQQKIKSPGRSVWAFQLSNSIQSEFQDIVNRNPIFFYQIPVPECLNLSDTE